VLALRLQSKGSLVYVYETQTPPVPVGRGKSVFLGRGKCVSIRKEATK
jgi:hypothetical protein